MLVYPDVRQAVAWLERVFGFAERVRIGEDHRSQVSVGEGAVPYEAEDLAGHRWTFSETIADAAPEDWGGRSGSAEPASTDGRPSSGRTGRFTGGPGLEPWWAVSLSAPS